MLRLKILFAGTLRKRTVGRQASPLQPDLVKRYKDRINVPLKAKGMEELMQINSPYYKTLKGDKAGFSSIRVNDKYRIEFTVKETIDEAILTLCNGIELSNHYE